MLQLNHVMSYATNYFPVVFEKRCLIVCFTLASADASQVSVSSSNYFDDSKVEELSCPGNVHNFMCITFNGKAQQIDVRWNNEPNGHHLFTVEYKSINPTNLSQWTSRSSYNYRHHDKVVLSSLLVHNNNASEGFVSLHRVNITGVDGIAGNGSATRLVLHCRNMKNNSEHGTVTESTKTLVFEGKEVPLYCSCLIVVTFISRLMVGNYNIIYNIITVLRDVVLHKQWCMEDDNESCLKK